METTREKPVSNYTKEHIKKSIYMQGSKHTQKSSRVRNKEEWIYKATGKQRTKWQ